MFAFAIMNSKERKRILEKLEEQFGCAGAFLKEYTFLFKENDGRIHLCNAEVAELLATDVRLDTAGLYFATLIPNGELRLSIEGSQLIGAHCSKNVITLDDAQFATWIRGNAVEMETDLHGFVLLKHGDEFCGCGKPVRDEKTDTVSIHNYIPKSRYVRSDD